MASENATSGNDQIKALEAQLAQMRKLQEQTESQLAELARQQTDAAERTVAEQVDDDSAIEPEAIEQTPEIDVRVVERDDPAEPPKPDGAGPSVLGAIKRKIERVSSRADTATEDTTTEQPSVNDSSAGATTIAIAAIGAVEDKLDVLSERITAAPHEAQAATQNALQQVMNEIITAISRQAQSTEQQSQTIRGDLKTIHSQAGQLAQQVAQIGAAVAEKEEEPTTAFAAPAELEAAICGETLAADQGLAPARRELVAEFLAGDRGAMGLAGQLLLFQAAAADRMPHLLKDVGEAYYRWRPQAAHAADPFQHAMIAWLMQACEQNGSANRIELVRPGDRYDAARHHAKTRGLEITGVYGWVVLRDNGKVYTKAAVAVT